MTAPAPGIYPDVPFDEYASWTYMSNTGLGYMAECPAKCEWWLNGGKREETAPLLIGRAMHCAILEWLRFQKLYAIGPDVDLRTKVGKDTWADFEAANPGKEFLRSKDGAEVIAMRDAAHRNPEVEKILEQPGRAEVSIVWDDEVTGVRCKGRLDWFTSIDGYSANVDLKFVAGASPREFSNAVASYGWHRQAAMYLDGLAAIGRSKGGYPVSRRYIFLVGEKSEPYLFSLYELDEPSIRSGRIRYRALLKWILQCQTSGVWPSYTEGIESISVPKWALDVEENVA